MKRMTTVMLLILIIGTPTIVQAQGQCYKRQHKPKAMTKCYNKMFKQKKRLIPTFSMPELPHVSIPQVKMPKVEKVAINIPQLQAPQLPQVKMPKFKKDSPQDCPR